MSTPTTYLLGAGAALSCATTSGGTFTAINQLKQISFTAAKPDYIDLTNLGSPAYATGAPVVKEVAPGAIDPGTAAITGILAPAGDPGQTAVSAAFGTQTKLYWKLQFAPAAGQTVGALREFAGYVSEQPTMDAQTNEAVSFNFGIKLTGVITDTAGS